MGKAHAATFYSSRSYDGGGVVVVGSNAHLHAKFTTIERDKDDASTAVVAMTAGRKEVKVLKGVLITPLGPRRRPAAVIELLSDPPGQDSRPCHGRCVGLQPTTLCYWYPK